MLTKISPSMLVKPDQSVGSLAELKAITPSSGHTVFLADGGRTGLFHAVNGDYSAEIAADPAQGIYVGADELPAAEGCWLRLWSGDLQAEWFGVKGDWSAAIGDAGATDDSAALQAALTWAGRVFAGGHDLGGGHGMRVFLPGRKTCLIGSSLTVPRGVRLLGHGVYSSVLKMKDTFPAGSHFIVLGDQDTHQADFGCALEDMQLFCGHEGASTKAMVYSNSAQHTAGVNRIKIFAGARVGLHLEVGYGGASTVTMDDVEIFNKGAISGNPGAILNYSGALTMVGRRWVVQGPTPGDASNVGVRIDGGVVILEGYHTEGIATGIVHNIRNQNNGQSLLRGVTGGFGMIAAIKVDSLAAAGTLSVVGIMPNGATYAVKNEATGSNVTGNQVAALTY